MSEHRNNVANAVSGTPGTGTITLGSAVTGSQSFSAAYGANATVDVFITEGTAWEVARNCTYTHSGTTLTRGTLEASSTGSALSLTSAAVVRVAMPASTGNSLEATLRSHISGLQLNWVSSSSISVSPGAAYVESLDRLLTVPSLITVSGLSSLTASTLHHVYLYDNAGTTAVEVSTTAPNGTPFAGVARSKNADTSRRYIGTFRTNASGSNNIIEFLTTATAGGGLVFMYLDDTGATPYRVVNLVAKATTAQSVNCSGVAPANVTSELYLTITRLVTSGSGPADIVLTLKNNATTRIGALAGNVASVNDYPGLPLWLPVLASLNPALYWYNLASSSASMATVIDLSGFRIAR